MGQSGKEDGKVGEKGGKDEEKRKDEVVTGDGEDAKEELHGGRPAEDAPPSSIECPVESCGTSFKDVKALKAHQRWRHPEHLASEFPKQSAIKLKQCPVADCEFVFKSGIL